MNTVETRSRTTSTHPAVDATFAAAARLAREATARHSTPQACRAVVDALSTPALGFAGIALLLDRSQDYPLYQVVAGSWPPQPGVDDSMILTVPLLLDDRRIGELTVYKHEGAFEEAEAALITAAAAHASLGVARARLLQELERLRRGNRRPAAKGASRKAVGKRGAAKSARARRSPGTRSAAKRGTRSRSSGGGRGKSR